MVLRREKTIVLSLPTCYIIDDNGTFHDYDTGRKNHNVHYTHDSAYFFGWDDFAWFHFYFVTSAEICRTRYYQIRCINIRIYFGSCFTFSV